MTVSHNNPSIQHSISALKKLGEAIFALVLEHIIASLVEYQILLLTCVLLQCCTTIATTTNFSFNSRLTRLLVDKGERVVGKQD